MGIYLNPGYGSFEEAVNSRIFVDKTEMMLYTNTMISTSQKYICVSRPRRFGKSITANMLCAYYGKPDSHELFERCKVSRYEDWDRCLGKYDVIRLVMTDYFNEDVEANDALAKMQKLIGRDLKKAYPDVDFFDTEDIAQSMADVYSETNRGFVVIIDEWDAIFRECKEDTKGQTKYLDFLRGWLKDKQYIALAYMTGILPIKKYGKHSALNMFDDYSIIAPMQLASYTGFTEDEVRDLCEEYNMDFAEISGWYDGYLVSDAVPVEYREKYRSGEYDPQIISIYNPLSVVKAMTNGIIQNYWNKTETYEALAEYIRMNQDGLKDAVALMMDGGSVKIDISTYQNDMTTFTCRDDVLALLINLGYLKYNYVTKEVMIPNKEILDEFKTSTKSSEWIDTLKAFKTSLELLDAIWACEEDKIAELLELAHDRAGNKTYNGEAALSYGIQYAMYAAQKYYTTIQELDSGKGYADIVYLPSPKYPDKPVILMELKYNKDVRTPADQVRERNYPQILEHYAGNILIVSVNYDKDGKDADFKRHSCRIERV